MKVAGSLSHRTGWSRDVSEAQCALMTSSAEQGMEMLFQAIPHSTDRLTNSAVPTLQNIEAFLTSSSSASYFQYKTTISGKEQLSISQFSNQSQYEACIHTLCK